jgi:hypothetical protein
MSFRRHNLFKPKVSLVVLTLNQSEGAAIWKPWRVKQVKGMDSPTGMVPHERGMWRHLEVENALNANSLG